MSESVKEIAEGVSGRVGGGYGIDPVTIGILVNTVLPLIIGCFKKKDNVTPDQVQSRVAELHAKNSKLLHRRLSKAYQEQALKAGKEESNATGKPYKKKVYELSDEAAYQLAHATIQEALSARSTAISEFCASA